MINVQWQFLKSLVAYSNPTDYDLRRIKPILDEALTNMDICPLYFQSIKELARCTPISSTLNHVCAAIVEHREHYSESAAHACADAASTAAHTTDGKHYVTVRTEQAALLLKLIKEA